MILNAIAPVPLLTFAGLNVSHVNLQRALDIANAAKTNAFKYISC